LVECGSKKHT